MADNDEIKGSKVFKKTGLFSEREAGRVDDEGTIHETTGVFTEEERGRIEGDGTIYRKTGIFKSEETGRIAEDGTIYKKTGTYNEEPVGRIAEDGTIYKKTGVYSEEEVGRIERKPRDTSLSGESRRASAQAPDDSGTEKSFMGVLVGWFVYATLAMIAFAFAIAAVAASSPVWGGALVIAAISAFVYWHRLKRNILDETGRLRAGAMVAGKKGKLRPEIAGDFLTKHLRGYPHKFWLTMPSVIWTVALLVLLWADLSKSSMFTLVLIFPVSIAGIPASWFCARGTVKLLIKSAIKRFANSQTK